MDIFKEFQQYPDLQPLNPFQKCVAREPLPTVQARQLPKRSPAAAAAQFPSGQGRNLLSQSADLQRSQCATCKPTKNYYKYLTHLNSNKLPQPNAKQGQCNFVSCKPQPAIPSKYQVAETPPIYALPLLRSTQEQIAQKNIRRKIVKVPD